MRKNKVILSQVFHKYEKMKKVLAYYNEFMPYYHASNTDNIKFKNTSKEAPFEKPIIEKVEAEHYIRLIDKAIEQLPETEDKPYRTIIKCKYLLRYPANRTANKIGYTIRSYFTKLKEAEKELAEFIVMMGINYN